MGAVDLHLCPPRPKYETDLSLLRVCAPQREGYQTGQSHLPYLAALAAAAAAGLTPARKREAQVGTWLEGLKEWGGGKQVLRQTGE